MEINRNNNNSNNNAVKNNSKLGKACVCPGEIKFVA